METNVSPSTLYLFPHHPTYARTLIWKGKEDIMRNTNAELYLWAWENVQTYRWLEKPGSRTLWRIPASRTYSWRDTAKDIQQNVNGGYLQRVEFQVISTITFGHFCTVSILIMSMYRIHVQERKKAGKHFFQKTNNREGTVICNRLFKNL